MNQSFDILVVGGGVVGLSAALGLAQRKFRVGLVDARNLDIQAPTSGGRLYAINQASRQLFDSLDVWSSIAPQAISTYRAMHVWDAVSGGSIDFDAKMIAGDRLGDFIDEQVLRHALLKAAHEEQHIVFFPNHSVRSIEEKALSIVIDTEKTQIEARGLLIADGAHSPCRTMLKIPQKQWSYHQKALVATVSCEKSHQRTAWQVFAPHGTLALLPMDDENQCSIVWSVQEQNALQLLQMPDDVFNDVLTKTFEHTLGTLQLLNARQSFPLMMRHTRQYVGECFVVMGDAAHTIHPLAGLGLNLGLKDVRNWLACVDRTPERVWPLKKHAAAYERARKADVWQHIACMQGLKDLFLSRLPGVASLRGLGLRTCNQMPWLKRWLIAQALDCPVDDVL